MDARNELFAYLGSAFVTIAVLFGAQQWYASYLDVSVVHGLDAFAPMDAKLAQVRSEEQAKLSGGAVSIDRAKQALVLRGRMASPKITPKPSDDLGAMSGWIQRPGFKAYVPRTPPAPPPAAAEAVPAEGAAAPEAAPAAAPSQAAPAAAAPTAAKPPVAAMAPAPATPKPAPAAAKVPAAPAPEVKP